LDRDQLFKKWIFEFKPLLFKIINVYSNTYFDREDLFQEISIQIWNSIPNFKGNSSAHTWIYRIALNTAIKWKSRNKNTIDSTHIQVGILQENVEPSTQLSWLYNEISKLDKIEKSITLLMLDGFSYKEIAGMTGLSVTHVGVKINRIKSYLKDRSKLL